MKFHTFRILEIRGQSSRTCVFSRLPLFYFFFLPRGKLEAPRAKTTGIRQSDDDIIIRPTPRTVGAGLQTEIVGRKAGCQRFSDLCRNRGHVIALHRAESSPA